jgi:hypothetical protein
MSNSVADAILHSQVTQARSEDTRESEAKANAPTEFDGTSRKKLDNFIAECKINFATSPRKFKTESSKVLFAGSYLKGNPKKWFTNFFSLPKNKQPAWLSSWVQFEEVLQKHWGLEDPEGAAEAEMQKLLMADKDHVIHFTAIFRTLQYRLQSWSDRSLRNEYYNSLAPRLRTQFVTAGRIPPPRLEDLIKMSEEFDRAYWANFEHNKTAKSSEEKKTSDDSQSSESQGKSKKRKTNNNISTPAATTAPSTSTSTSSTTTTQATSGSSKKKDPAYKKLLGPDGKLLPQERERRITNGLCLLCGQKGHMADDCPKRTKPSNPAPTAARATITITPPATGSITEITE